MLGHEGFAVPVDGKKISTAIILPEGGFEAATAIVVLAHGAQSDMDQPLLVAMTEGLAEGGFAAVRFNFPYREAGRKTPDPAPRLEATWLAVTDMLRERLEGLRRPLVVGGKSLGGRIAAGLVADGVIDAEGLVFLGYPLHRPGLEETMRDEALRKIGAPMLFFAGTKDRMCRLDLLERVRRGIEAPTELHILEGADHSLTVPRRERDAPPSDLRTEIVALTLAWLKKTIRRRGAGARGSRGRRSAAR